MSSKASYDTVGNSYHMNQSLISPSKVDNKLASLVNGDGGTGLINGGVSAKKTGENCDNTVAIMDIGDSINDNTIINENSSFTPRMVRKFSPDKIKGYISILYFVFVL